MNILMLGRNLSMMEMGAAPIREAGHTVTMCVSDEEAKTGLASGAFNALLLGMAIEQATRTDMRAFIGERQLDVKLLEPMSPMDLPDVLDALKTP
jgi:hypothetical protein